MASFLALPALSCLLVRVRVSREPISQTSLMLLPTFPSCCSQHTATGQGKEKSTNVHLSHRQSNYGKETPVHVQSNARPFAALKLEGSFSPALSPFPARGQLLSQQSLACRTHPTHARGNKRALLLCSLFGFCKQSIPCMPQSVYYQVIQILGPGAR